VIGEAMTALRKERYAGLVVVVDDLDKMVIRPVDHAYCSTAEYLFIHRAAQLTAFACHMVYTLPLSLAFSHHEQSIKSNFGGHVPLVPMVKVASKPPKPRRYNAGIEKMRAIIETRCANAGLSLGDLFAAGNVGTDLIRLSGGQPLELMSLVREGLVTCGLPIDERALHRARKEGEREYARMLRQEHWPILNEVRKTGAYTPKSDTEQAFRELIDSRAILQYVNDEEWYALNPMLAGLKAPPVI
ncbi:MAG: hypothetical protein K8F90_18535, partial [Hyphomicrobiales bacterium]|nr:hypothetical protein [Hyphomicrobiales bacterium]